MVIKIVICLYCSKKFDKDKEEYVKVGRRYVHKTCYEEKEKETSNKVPKKNLRKCLYCKGDIDITKEEYCMARANRYAHKKCYEKNSSPDEIFIPQIYSYLKAQVHITYDYPQCEKQRVYFVTKLGYTNEGIYNALRYFYGVKKASPDKSGNRIGIVPYIYEEAKEYYKNLENKQKFIKKEIEKQKETEKETIYIPIKKVNPKKTYIDLDMIGE